MVRRMRPPPLKRVNLTLFLGIIEDSTRYRDVATTQGGVESSYIRTTLN